jgi:hypothetical protein
VRYRIICSLLLVLAALPATSSAAVDQPTGLSSGNVEHVATVPFDAGFATGGRLVKDHFYVAGARSFLIYDVSDPLDPQLMSITPVGFLFANEDVDTNGEILLMSDDQIVRGLHIYDVSDKTMPVKLSEVPNLRDHNYACVLDCTWAYGTRGTIVDLRDPTAPKVAGSWGGGQGPGDGFDTTETSPGRVLSATRTIRFMDARKDPTFPKTLALGPTRDNRLIHSIKWPRSGKDRFMLVQEETFVNGVCSENSGTFMTWDASKWKRTKTFTMIDEYRLRNGTIADGSPPANVFGCTAMWFDEHPDFRNGGLVTGGWFEHGTRFVEVDPKGAITEVGYFLPAGGSTIASYWITDDIVYSVDVVRGIDILRFEG